MRIVRSSLAAPLFVLALVIAAAPALAQTDSTQAAPKTTAHASGHGVDYMGGGYFVGSFPVGDWGKIAGFGLGLDGSSITRPHGKSFGLRMAARVQHYIGTAGIAVLKVPDRRPVPNEKKMRHKAALR